MSALQHLSVLALETLVESSGLDGGGRLVARISQVLGEHFADPSKKLPAALQSSADRAWRTLEMALAGDSLWNRCKSLVARGDEKALATQVRTFLDTVELPDLPGDRAQFRTRCLKELREARQARLLSGGTIEPTLVSNAVSTLARFDDPTRLAEAQWKLLDQMAEGIRKAGAGKYDTLAQFLKLRPAEGPALLSLAVRYFFRRAVESDAALFQSLALAKLDQAVSGQVAGLAAIESLVSEQSQRLEELLGGIQAVVVETHEAVLDLQQQMEGQSDQIRQIGNAVQKLLEQHQLQKREVRPGDSLSIRNDEERGLVRQLVARYRAMPEGERKSLPALLNAIGKLELVSGDFEAAQKDFAGVAGLVGDARARAEAHHNTYLAALERDDLDGAMKSFIEAVKLDSKRFAPFPVGKYHPLRILGAGGFGTAFLCRHRYMNADVVVKTLRLEQLGRETDKVFTEAQVLRQLDHPAIIRIAECGYVDPSTRSRPHLIMDYFPGTTLEGQVKTHGALAVPDLLAIARQVAEGLQAAHGARILHRDVKPANLLVRQEPTGWRVKIIDFGLALPQKLSQAGVPGSSAGRSLIGSSIAGTLHYAAPEQMGQGKEPVGPYSDVFGWAKTCCFALFQTTQPLMKHWQSIPADLAGLLEECLAENPRERPANFGVVLERLAALQTPVAAAQPAVAAPALPELVLSGGSPFSDLSAAAAPGEAAPVASAARPRRSMLIPALGIGGVGALAIAVGAVMLLRGGGSKSEFGPPPPPEIRMAGETVRGEGKSKGPGTREGGVAGVNIPPIPDVNEILSQAGIPGYKDKGKGSGSSGGSKGKANGGPAVRFLDASLALEPGKSGKLRMSIDRPANHTGEIALRIDCPSALTVEKTFTVEDGQVEVEIPITAGERSGRFTVKVTPTLAGSREGGEASLNVVVGEGPTSAKITADFLPHQAGRTRTYLSATIAKGVVSVLQLDAEEKDDNSIEMTPKKTGTLIGSDLRTGTVRWSKAAPPPAQTLHRRVYEGYLQMGEPGRGDGEIVWESVLKLGAQEGDTWETDLPGGVTKKYQVVKFTKVDGKLAVQVQGTVTGTTADSVTQATYVEGVGVIERSTSLTSGGDSVVVGQLILSK
ncbi:MAG: serine/threonine-protein kinase [Gemmataceae bacterium]